MSNQQQQAGVELSDFEIGEIKNLHLIWTEWTHTISFARAVIAADRLQRGKVEPVAKPVGAEMAPPTSLPDWAECNLRVHNSNFIEQRIAEGGYGAEADAKLATQLHRFIHEYDDADPVRSSWFMHRLELLLSEVRQAEKAPSIKAIWPVAWQSSWLDMSDNCEGWSTWKHIEPQDVELWKQRVAGAPNYYQMRPLYDHPQAEKAPSHEGALLSTDDLRKLAAEKPDPMAPHLLDSMRRALRWSADVIDAAEVVIQEKAPSVQAVDLHMTGDLAAIGVKALNAARESGTAGMNTLAYAYAEAVLNALPELYAAPQQPSAPVDRDAFELLYATHVFNTDGGCIWDSPEELATSFSGRRSGNSYEGCGLELCAAWLGYQWAAAPKAVEP